MARLVVGAVALVLALGGCGGDPKADPSPSPSSPVTSPVSTTPSAPVMPDEAKADTKAGAIAFVKYYVGLINHLQETGDDAPLRGASQPDCKSCNAVVRAAKAIYDAGGHVDGGAWTLENVTASHPTTGLWSVRVKGQIAPSSVVSAGPSAPKTGSGGRGDAEFFVAFAGQWKVAQWHTG